MKQAEADSYDLEVVECSCGFYLGIDATYIEQVGDVSFVCPACGEKITNLECQEGGKE